MAIIKEFTSVEEHRIPSSTILLLAPERMESYLQAILAVRFQATHSLG